MAEKSSTSLQGSMRRIVQIAFLGAGLVASILLGAIAGPQQALATATRTFFGGKVTKVTYCPCAYDFAVIITLDDIQGKQKQEVSLKWSIWSSTLHEYYNIWEKGVWVLGGFGPGDTECRQQSGYSCKKNSDAPSKIDGVIDTVRGIGTSAAPTNSQSPI